MLLTEKQFSQVIVDLARLRGWLVHRTPTWRATGTDPGFPDLVLARGRRLIFAELKSQKGKLTVEQEAWRQALDWGDQGVYCWKPSDFDQITKILK